MENERKYKEASDLINVAHLDMNFKLVGNKSVCFYIIIMTPLEKKEVRNQIFSN